MRFLTVRVSTNAGEEGLFRFLFSGENSLIAEEGSVNASSSSDICASLLKEGWSSSACSRAEPLVEDAVALAGILEAGWAVFCAPGGLLEAARD